MSEIFICDIIRISDELEKDLINTEFIILYAESIEEAFGKILVHKESNVELVNLTKDRLLGRVDTKGNISYILIAKPDEIWPSIEK